MSDRITDEKEVADLREQLAAAQSKEVCTVAHSDEVMEFCPYCKIERLQARLAGEQERLDFLQGFLFTRRWMPPIGSPFTWELVGHWRHQIKDLKGETFRGAIDAARAADSALLDMVPAPDGSRVLCVADSAPAAMSAEEHCKMFCAWKGGGPCLAADCPRRKEDSAPVGRECQTLAALDSEDAARFRWLCDDHADKAVRHLRDSLLERMSMMSLSAVRAAIGTHLSNMSEQAKAKNSHHE